MLFTQSIVRCNCSDDRVKVNLLTQMHLPHTVSKQMSNPCWSNDIIIAIIIIIGCTYIDIMLGQIETETSDELILITQLIHV